jgi:sucrose phosphorylase
MKNGPFNPSTVESLKRHLVLLYGESNLSDIISRLERIVQNHLAQSPSNAAHAGPLTEQDAVLITYGDQVLRGGQLPLQTLISFLQTHIKGIISGVHILPFFPYSSDDGFSVIDYHLVNPDIGSWEDISEISSDFRFMVDAVVNHISVRSDWFQGFLQGDPLYKDYFISVDPEADLSMVVRPRDLPLLTPFDTHSGQLHVWTTFSADQADLNYGNPDVLLEIIDLLLFYIRQGTQLIRLDAIGFLWKEIGSASIHLPQTHAIVQLMRTIVDSIAPWAYLITETNVPHRENVSYFGDGNDEAHLVYQFALPPLVLHTLLTGDAASITAWASELATPSQKTTFFNFLASHDGIGLRPAQNYLSGSDMDRLVEWTEECKGGVSYRRVGEGGRNPYELNITYFDALRDPDSPDTPSPKWIARFICSQAIMLSMAGIPGIYFHSLFGSRNDLKGVEATGRLRSINREKIQADELAQELSNPMSTTSHVYRAYCRLLTARRRQPAFNPYAPQRVLDLHPGIFALVRTDLAGFRRMLCLHEVAGRTTRLNVNIRESATTQAIDILTAEELDLSACELEPYQVRWITIDE